MVTLIKNLLGHTPNDIPVKFERIRVVANFQDATKYINVTFAYNTTVKITSKENIVVTRLDDVNIGTGTEIEFVTSSSTRYIKIKSQNNGDNEIYIYNKYKIEGLDFSQVILKEMSFEYLTALKELSIAQNGDDAIFNINELAEDTKITAIKSYGEGSLYGDISALPDINYKKIAIQGGIRAKLSGNISKFYGKSSIEHLQFPTCSLEGNIEGLDDLISCTIFSFTGNSLLEGDVCVLAEALWHNGNTSSTVNFGLTGTQCTINGDDINGKITAIFSQSGIVITCGIYTYTFDGTSWTKTLTQ